LNLALHEAIFNNDVEEAKKLIESKECDINQRDKFGNTALHLATMMGFIDCVTLLTDNQCDVNIKNERGWTPLAEAVSFGSRTSIRSILSRIKRQSKASLEERRPQLVETLQNLQDFQMDIKWEFHSWVPIISRWLPSDTCKISKKGCNIRLDTTLIEFTDMKWQRGDISFLFNGAKKESETLVVLDNEKQVFQKLNRNEPSGEIEEEIDYLMSSDIVTAQMSTKPITFSPAQNGWIFKENRIEQIGEMECEVFNVQGMTVVSQKRREHLSEEDVKKNKEMVEAFQRGDTSLMENDKTQTFPRKESLSPPTKNSCTWKEYISAERLPTLGRAIQLTESKKALKVNVWMCQDFPLSVKLLLNVLNVVAPLKHFEKMKDFVSLKLPVGFPVKIEIPVLPTIVARITFNDFKWKDDLVDSLFTIPSNYKEDQHHFPDL